MRVAFKRLSYANVAATLALVLSMAGGAVAAKRYLINSTSQINPKVLKTLKSTTGPQGLPGPAGPPGQTGGPGPEGREGRAASLHVVGWAPLILEDEWGPSGNGSGPPEFTKDAEGFVHLKGGIDGMTRTSVRFAKLPPGFRPATEDVWIRAEAENGQGDPHLVDIQIKEGGEMAVLNGTGASDDFVSLEGLTFFAG
jgi:hypothetical protein